MKKPGAMIRELLKQIGRKPATVLYPAVKVTMPARFRGRLVFDPAKCIGCKMCMRDCPTGAIVIQKVGEKKFAAEIDNSKCIYCAQCVDSCPKDALAATGDFELAQLDRGKLQVTFAAADAPVPSTTDADATRHPEGKAETG
jgi:formate hydrogenlyase subunit 6/NADH:ubiquinone oxidoreductase subunit I